MRGQMPLRRPKAAKKHTASGPARSRNHLCRFERRDVPLVDGATALVHLTDSGLMCYEAAGHMLISAAVEAHMCTSSNQLMRIALLLTAIDAALVLFPVTAHAGSGFRRAIDAGVAG